jgi:hypothetical protein
MWLGHQGIKVPTNPPKGSKELRDNMKENFFPYIAPSYADQFLALTARPDLPNRVSVRWVAQHFKRPWTELRPTIMTAPKVIEGLPALGWVYRPDVGCKAQPMFERTRNSRPNPDKLLAHVSQSHVRTRP